MKEVEQVSPRLTRKVKIKLLSGEVFEVGQELEPELQTILTEYKQNFLTEFTKRVNDMWEDRQ